MSSQSQREKRIRRVLEFAEFFVVTSDHPDTIKLCGRYRNSTGKKKRIGTFARVMRSTPLTDESKAAIVSESIRRGVVLTTDDSAAVVLACSLKECDPEWELPF